MIQISGKWRTIADYVGLTEEDLDILSHHADFFREHGEALVDEFYQEIMKVDGLRSIIEQRTTLERLRQTQLRYFRSLFEPLLDDSYVKGRERIGDTHMQVGVSQEWVMAANAVYARLVLDRLDDVASSRFFSAFLKRLLFDGIVMVARYVEATQTENRKYREDMGRLGEELKGLVGELSNISSAYTDSALQLAKLHDNLTEAITKLKDSIGAIREVAEFAMDVAAQTNLLGLNAAIEAARVGQAGRGFGVVAEEIRNLANRAKESVSEIQQTVQRVVDEVRTVDGQVDRVTALAQKQAASAEEVGRMIQTLERLCQELRS